MFSSLSDTDERTDNDETDHSNDFVSEDLPDNDNQPLYTHSERVPKVISSKSSASQLIPEPEEKDSEIPSNEGKILVQILIILWLRCNLLN